MIIDRWTVVKYKEGRTSGVSVGDKYNRLTALEHVGETSTHRSLWKWECDCGEVVYNLGDAVKYGNTKSCGCLAKESKPTLTHGMRQSPEYNIWCHIKGRCYRPSHDKYQYYGGRGIKMCDTWRDSFEAFYNDMGPRPAGLTSIDRKDTDGDYTKDNCRWSNQTMQCNNRRINRFILYGKDVFTLQQMADKLQVDSRKLDYWLRAGYEMDEIIYRIENKISFKKGRPCTRILVDRSDIYIPYDKLKEMGYANEE